MAKKYVPTDVNSMFAEIAGESDRAAISVAGSFLDYALERCIESRLREAVTSDEHKALFSDGGIASTFYQKAWLAYFLKIIGPVTRRDIELIRSIRNTASHDMNPISFEHTPEIAARCRELIAGKDANQKPDGSPDLRLRFIVTAQFIAGNLLLRASDSNSEIKQAFEQLAPYLDR